MNNSKISVIVPVYNLEKYIEKTINALIEQTYKNLEIIIIDDGSTDSSANICKKYADMYNNIIFLSQKNAGVSSARNKGIELATGDYIGFCDGDDLPDNDMYEFLYNLIQESNADISCCQVRFILQDGKIKNIATNRKNIFTDKNNILMNFFNNNIPMGVYTKLFKSNMLKNVRFNEKYKINEDKLFVFEALLKSNILCNYSVAKYSYFRRNSSSSITEFSAKYYDMIEIADYISEKINNNYPLLKNMSEGSKLNTYLRYYKLMCQRNGIDNFKYEEKYVLKFIKSFNITVAKQYISKKDLIRFMALRINKVLFKFMIKYFDKF